MSTRTEHIARLTEMSVRAQEAADWLAQNVEHGAEYAQQQYGYKCLLEDHVTLTVFRQQERKWAERAETAERERDTAMQAHADDLSVKDAHVERLLSDIRGLVQRAENAESERDTLRQERDAATDARRDAERMRDRMVTRLREVRAALNTPHGINETPRLVRELRDERDRLKNELGDERQQVKMLAAERDTWEDRAAQNMGEAIDLKARAVVLPENLTDHFEAALFGSIPGDGTRRLEANYLARLVRSWRPEPASREPGCSNECSEMHTYELPCDLATEDAGRVCGSDECDGDCAEPASREPEAPGFQTGDRVWLTEVQRPATFVHASPAGSALVNLDDGHKYGSFVERLRHVYDADHEPPEGVDVVRDMGEQHRNVADQLKYQYLRRADDGEWQWVKTPSSPAQKLSFPWRYCALDANGPLVEHREGDR